MAKGGGSRGQRRDAAPRRAAKPGQKRAQKARQTSTSKKPRGAPVVFDAPPPAQEEPRRLRLGTVAGATPGRWIDTWRERFPDVPVEVVPLELSSQQESLRAGGVDLALVRVPLDPDGLSVIALYDEIAVVVCSADSALTAVEELDPADLEGEVLLVPRDAVYDIDLPGTLTPRVDPPADTAEAIATVAAGVGIVIVPLSLARLHSRKDAAHRPLRGAATSTVALAWPTARTTPDVEAFIGIVRGRTANSSR
ncbi:DNA-binding transcriptional regulator, LysR family [Microbacterium pygmaeum]|uniref:DNA-binding transcriptional regulator, LysR family n=2 Tax=Microbacterium pygmaeum TaxID=370764 RepID=A0A1G7TP71_9MICO|nr:DNA-binding transcriptional regulator, LysR family [Microbacterium pygmaeum]